MKIAIASDHAGFLYKEAIIPLLRSLGHEVTDHGTYSTNSTPYPLWIFPAAAAVARGEADRAIVLGGSGNGEAITANKVKGIRCALCWTEQTAIWSREHNDANALAIGERTLSLDLCLKIVRLWLDTPFEGGRHVERLTQISRIETTGTPT